MAAYNTRVKVIINDMSTESDSTAGSYAKELNDFVETLDSTTNAIIEMNSTQLRDGRIMTVILYNG